MRKHMIGWGRVLFTMTILAAMCSFYRAQDNNLRRPADKDNYAFLDRPDSEVASQEEKMIKKAYDKLTFLANVHRERNNLIERQTAQAGKSTNRIAFSVNIISSGGIEEVSGRPMNLLVTQPSGERIDVTPVTTTSGDDKKGKASYAIRWTESPYVYMNERNAWPLRDVLTAMGPGYADVHKYTTYEVMVVLDGKSENYLALALYHTPLQSSEEPRIEFWDSIAGMSGVLTKVFNEQLPPLETSLESRSIAGCAGCTRQTDEQFESNIFFGENNRNHETGSHQTTSVFKGICEGFEDCHHSCSAYTSYSDCRDDGITSEILYVYHVCGKSEIQEGSSANKSVQITCKAGVGYGFDDCIFSTCGVSVSASWQGIGISVQGGTLWNKADSANFTCMAR